jgi:streptomycin 6-kinase
MTAQLEVPELVRQRAMAYGNLGRRWLDELPLVVATLAERWELQIGHAFQGGTAAFVTSATEGSGRACALKVAMPPEIDPLESFRRSVLVHRLAAGRGCAELIRHDESIPAMLLERLGPNLDDLDMSVPQILETVTTTLRSFWQPLVEDCGLPSGPEKAAWLAGYITTTWDELGRPCERTVIERAVRYCGERATAYDPSRAVLVHGDAHGWNTLDAGGGTFKFVDPEGLRSERAHDLSVPMREYNQPLLLGDTARLVRERAELLASWCEIDPEPVWQWGFIERVSTGLANVRDFEGDEGLDFLEVAARCL